jgi:hypothetical protein
MTSSDSARVMSGLVYLDTIHLPQCYFLEAIGRVPVRACILEH